MAEEQRSDGSARSTPQRYGANRGVLWVVFAWGALVTGGGSIVSVGFAIDGYWTFLVPWFLAVSVFWYYALVFVSIEARLWPDGGRLQFRSVLRTKDTHLSEVISVGFALRGFNERLVTIRYRGGIARVVNVGGIPDLAQQIREGNPAVQVSSLRSRFSGVTGT